MQYQTILIQVSSQYTFTEALDLIRLQSGRALSLNDPNLLLIDSQDKQIGIQQIRELVVWNSKKPFDEGDKIALVLHAENMTEEAQNALLKTIEEPTSCTQIFLTTTNPRALLPTIISRVQTIFLPEKTPIHSRETTNVHKYLAGTFLDRIGISEHLVKSGSRGEILNFVQQLLAELLKRQRQVPTNTDNLTYINTTESTYRALRKNANPKIALLSLAIALMNLQSNN